MRPVDLQDNLSKAPFAAREQHVQQTAPEVAQRHVARELAQEQILDHSRTRPTEQADPAENRVYDRERGSPRHGRQGSGRAAPEEQAPGETTQAAEGALDEETSGRRIDITA